MFGNAVREVVVHFPQDRQQNVDVFLVGGYRLGAMDVLRHQGDRDIVGPLFVGNHCITSLLHLSVQPQLRLAFRTQAVDFHVISGNEVAGLFARQVAKLTTDFRKLVTVYIGDFTTIITDDVEVGVTKIVVMDRFVVALQLDDQLVVDQELDRVINGGHTDLLVVLL